jgi:hypothetical protein
MGLGHFVTTSYVISFKKKYFYVLKIVEMLYLFFPYKKLSIMKLKRKTLWAGDEKQILWAGDEKQILWAGDEKQILWAGDEKEIMLSDSYSCNINLSLSLILTNI